MNSTIVFCHLLTLLLTFSIIIIWYASKLNIVTFLQHIINPVSLVLPDVLLFVVQVMCITLIICLTITLLYWLYQFSEKFLKCAPDPAIGPEIYHNDCLLTKEKHTVGTNFKNKCHKCACNMCEILTITVDGSYA